MTHPEHVVAIPVADVDHYIGRRTRRLVHGQTQWATITAARDSGLHHGGWTWIRVDHHDGWYGNHRHDLYMFIEATADEAARAEVQKLRGGYGTHPLLTTDDPATVPTEVGDAYVLF